MRVQLSLFKMAIYQITPPEMNSTVSSITTFILCLMSLGVDICRQRYIRLRPTADISPRIRLCPKLPMPRNDHYSIPPQQPYKGYCRHSGNVMVPSERVFVFFFNTGGDTVFNYTLVPPKGGRQSKVLIYQWRYYPFFH